MDKGVLTPEFSEIPTEFVLFFSTLFQVYLFLILTRVTQKYS